MNARSVSRLIAVAVTVVSSAFADSRTDEWIAKARAAVGTESALDAVTSVHYSGTLETTQKVRDEKDPNKVNEVPLRAAVDIILQKPCQQKNVLRTDKTVETTALDDYDGWIRRSEAGRGEVFQLLDAAQVRHLRANTWESLFFFRGIEKRGGTVEYRGEAEVDGTPCVVLAFIYPDNIVFTRYLDKATGTLVKTVTEGGGEIREKGSIIEQGVRFPKVLVNKSPSGQIITITFDKITLNETVPASEFALPAITMGPRPASSN